MLRRLVSFAEPFILLLLATVLLASLLPPRGAMAAVVASAADVGIVGRAGLSTRDYSQSVIVSANVGNTLPVVGLFTGGPQVAAALLLFSQIFKKPLKDMGQVYYAVDGTWDEPVIGNSNSEHFAETSSMAGCINTAE